MSLAIFDLDHTLIQGDSDYLWGVFLGEQGIVDAEEYERENERFYAEYRRGQLDIQEFLRFSFRVLRDNPLEDLLRWRDQFLREKIEPILTESARALVEQHRAQGHQLLIITATNAFITEPIAQRFGIPHLIATLPEMKEGRFTGEVAGIPAFQEGKVKRLETWLKETGECLAGSYFYSDSHNDLPLLERVDHPIAVNPDDRLRRIAQSRGWSVRHL